MTTHSPWRFSIAPMMDWTDRHCRVFHRHLTRRARLYSEMVTADAVIHGDRERLIGFSGVEHPIALQLGGNEPAKLAEAARIGAGFGYDEINLNCGCPSDRVQSGAFGACLMRAPDVVARCVEAMREAVDLPVTIKNRIGVDDDDPRETLFGFVETVSHAGCEVFITHARKAWLKGLSPKENRTIPPLDYDLVRDLKAAFPHLTIVLNGGLENVAHGAAEMGAQDGVMLGRAAYQDPACLLAADPDLFGETAPAASIHAAMSNYRSYIEAQLSEGIPLHAMTRHLLGAFTGLPGARAWRRTLSENATKTGAGLEVFDTALACVPDPLTAPMADGDRTVRARLHAAPA